MEKATILIVDNDPDTIRPVQEFLEREGYRIRTATSPAEARRAIQEDQVDLAIVDVRLIDDSDDKDFSGLDLAKELDPAMPKILLTRYPSVQAVRGALGPRLNAGPPAVSFLVKNEGLDALLRRVRLALYPRDSLLRQRVLDAFNSPDTMALPERMNELGPEVAVDRLRGFIDSQRQELTAQRDLENRRATNYHRAGIVASLAVILIIVVAMPFVLAGSVPAAALSACSAIVATCIGRLLSSNEDKAHTRVRAYFQQLEELFRMMNLLQLCDSIENSIERDRYRQKMLDHFVERLSALDGPGLRRTKAGH